jgi:manganese-dependent inorganic pyrophosphatase
MKEEILVFGHKNPDTDSICSAIAYSKLKNILGKEETQPRRLGAVSKETQYALDYFNAEQPELLETVKPTVGIINSGCKAVIKDSDSLKTAREILTREKYSSLPVINSENKLEDMLHVSQMSNAYLDISTDHFFDYHYTTYQNVLNSLDIVHINGELPKGRVYGDLKTLSEIGTDAKNGIVIVSDTKAVTPELDKYNISLLIVCFKKKLDVDLTGIKTPMVHTTFSIFKTFKLVSQSISIHSILKNSPFYQFSTSDYIYDIQPLMKEADQTNFPIVNKRGEVYSTIRNKHLLDVAKVNVILVDHNEKAQSVDGIETARILEIVDHHKFGDVETSEPLMIRAESVGCTSTIIYRLYEEANIIPDRQTAGLMLSAILSDTLIFKSPTTTKRDVEVAEKLEAIIGIDMYEYGMDLLIAGASLADKSPLELLTMDMKEFTMGNHKTALAQVNTVDVSSVINQKEDIMKEINKMISENGYNLFMLVVTDIINKGSQILAFGDSTDLVVSAFRKPLENDMLWLKGVVSRKKQIVPVLMQASQE